jgi:hypothetical protein
VQCSINPARNDTTFLKVLALPSVLCGSECRPLTKKDLRQIEAAEMRYFRLVSGYRRTDQRKNEDIRQDLNIFNLREKINACQQHYYKKILRMQTDRITRKPLDYHTKERRERGPSLRDRETSWTNSRIGTGLKAQSLQMMMMMMMDWIL